jgi:two-component sensor histidine kinase
VARADNGHIVLSVRDEGAGLPAGFDPQTTKSLGMRIITAFAQQLGGQVRADRRSPGTEFVVSIPLANEPGPSARKD